MPQTPTQVYDRFKFTGTKGGKRQQYAQTVLNLLAEAAKAMEAMHPDGTDKTNFMNAIDTACTAVHSAVVSNITN